MKIPNWILTLGITVLISACGINGKNDRKDATQSDAVGTEHDNDPAKNPLNSIRFKMIPPKEVSLVNGQKVFVFGSFEKSQLQPPLLGQGDQTIPGPIQSQREELTFQEFNESEKGVPTRKFSVSEIKSSIFFLRTASENDILIATEGTVAIHQLTHNEQIIDVNSDPFLYCSQVSIPQTPLPGATGAEASFPAQIASCNLNQICDVKIHLKLSFGRPDTDQIWQVPLSSLTPYKITRLQDTKVYRKKTRETNVSRIVKFTIPGRFEFIPNP